MSTTIVETWATEISKLGPIYPFVGSEFALFIIGIIFWIGFHVFQARIESEEIEKTDDLAKSRDFLHERINKH